MPRATGLSRVIYQAPDLDRMAGFMADFGLAVAVRTADALYLRGTGTAPCIHATLRGAEPRFIAGAFQFASREDLDALATVPGSCAPERMDAPGGGLLVRMRLPGGERIDAVCDVAEAAPLPLRAPHPFNAAADKRRIDRPLRPLREPAAVLRIGHFVQRVRDHDATVAWLCRHFGLVPSDHLGIPGDPPKVIGTFLRLAGDGAPVDHHSMLVLESTDPGVHHCSFEVQDVDAIMAAHEYLVQRGHVLDCGVGRHLLGSQIFDYWRDPFGFRVEHYTDGDVVTAAHRPEVFTGTAEETTQWGMKPPPEFFA